MLSNGFIVLCMFIVIRKCKYGSLHALFQSNLGIFQMPSLYFQKIFLYSFFLYIQTSIVYQPPQVRKGFLLQNHQRVDQIQQYKALQHLVRHKMGKVFSNTSILFSTITFDFLISEGCTLHSDPSFTRNILRSLYLKLKISAHAQVAITHYYVLYTNFLTLYEFQTYIGIYFDK